jgi:hypothetical protein
MDSHAGMEQSSFVKMNVKCCANKWQTTEHWIYLYHFYLTQIFI